MRARIERVDDLHDAYVYEQSMDDLHAIADYCKARQNSDIRGATGDKDMRMLAEIPGIIV
jgi:hypothetical protein